MKMYKIVPIMILIISVMVISNPVYAGEYIYTTHIDVGSKYTLNQGITKDIKAELWADTNAFWGDNWLNDFPVMFDIQNSQGQHVLEKVVKTNSIGNAHLKLDTSNMVCGDYNIHVIFEGLTYDKSIYLGPFSPPSHDYYIYDPSEKSAKLIIIPKK
jgi:hypothetical protein